MQSENNSYVKFVIGTIFFLFLQVTELRAQLPVCSGPSSRLIYYTNGFRIYNLDPTKPLSATNPVANTLPMPSGTIAGIAVGKNINGPGPSTTFYLVSGGTYHYYNGSTWVNTNHQAGAVNPGGGGNFYYSIEALSGKIYKYDGTGDATLLTTISDFRGGGAFDCVCDCHGNFYILRTDTALNNPPYLRKYSPAGTLLQSWTVTGANSVGSGGLAIIGGKVYFAGANRYWEGTTSGSNINFTLVSTGLSPGASDFASCALSSVGSGGQATVSRNPVYFCDTTQVENIVSQGHQPGDNITWKLLSGTATITGGGLSINVNVQSDAKILLTVANTDVCGSESTDTINLVLLKAQLDAGPADTIIYCKDFIDKLNGKVWDTTTGGGYNIAWEPQQYVLSGSNTLTPTVKFNGITTFVMTLRTGTDRSNCVWRDTVERDMIKQVTAALSIEDTVICTDEPVRVDARKSIVHPYSGRITYAWDMGDGTLGDKIELEHMYAAEGMKQIRLIVTDSVGCSDTAYCMADVLMPPYIELGSDTTICNGLMMTIPTSENTEKSVKIYTWWDGNTQSSRVINSAGKYVLHVGNECRDYTDTFELIIKDCSIWFPSAFTPNGDGRNDLARVLGKHLDDIENYEMMIMNRYGEQVFQTTDIFKGWDGNHKSIAAPVGSFFYLIKYRLKGSDKDELMTGDLTLIR